MHGSTLGIHVLFKCLRKQNLCQNLLNSAADHDANRHWKKQMKILRENNKNIEFWSDWDKNILSLYVNYAVEINYIAGGQHFFRFSY